MPKKPIVHSTISTPIYYRVMENFTNVAFKMTSLTPGSPDTLLIQTQTAQYMQQNGKWVTQPLAPQKIIDHINRMAKSAKMDCRKLGAPCGGRAPMRVGWWGSARPASPR